VSAYAKFELHPATGDAESFDQPFGLCSRIATKTSALAGFEAHISPAAPPPGSAVEGAGNFFGGFIRDKVITCKKGSSRQGRIFREGVCARIASAVPDFARRASCACYGARSWSAAARHMHECWSGVAAVTRRKERRKVFFRRFMWRSNSSRRGHFRLRFSFRPPV